MGVIRRARARGRNVILYRANNSRGVKFNGFVSRDNNTIYVRVGSLGPNMFSLIKDRSARKAIEREYERVMLQIVRHENFHLLERDPEMAPYMALTDNYLDRATSGNFADIFENEERALEFAIGVLGMKETEARAMSKTSGGRAKIVSELRAEAASEIDALRKAGGESLLIDRNIIDQVMDRIRRSMTRAGFRGVRARHALQSIELELKADVAQSAVRAAEARKPGQPTTIRFSAEFDTDGFPTYATGDTDAVLFSRQPIFEGERWLDQQQSWQDRNIRLRKAIAGIETDLGAKIPDNINPIQLLDITPGLLARQGEGFVEGSFKPIINDMQKEGISAGDMGKFLMARHAEEANKYLKESENVDAGQDSGMTDPQAAEIVAQMERELGPDKFKALEELADRLKNIASETLDLMRDSGLITQKDYDDIKDKYENYVPLADMTRLGELADQQDERVHPTKVGNVMMFRKGRDEEGGNVINKYAKNPKDLEKFFQGLVVGVGAQRTRVMRRVLKNNAGMRILRLAETFADDGQFKAELGRRDAKGNLITGSVKDDQIIVRVDRDMVLFGKPFFKGEQVVVSIEDKNIVKMLKTSSIRIDGPGGMMENWWAPLVKAATFYTGIKRSFATRFNIDFVFVNPVRDVFEANSTMKSLGMESSITQLSVGTISNFLTILSNVRGQRHNRLDSNDPEYQEYIDSGARQSSYRVQSPEDLHKMIKGVVAKGDQKLPRKIVAKAGFPVRVLGNILSDLTNTLDDSVRFTAWKMAKAQGMTTEQATAFSRDVTIDFSRHGHKMGAQFNQIFSFSNVGTQGIEKLNRKIRSGRFLSAAMPLIKTGLLQALLTSLMLDDDEMEEIRDDIASGNFIIPLPFLDEDGKHYLITIPLPYGLRSVHNAARLVGSSMMRPALGGTGPGMVEMGVSMMSSISEINPFNSGSILADASKTDKDNTMFEIGGAAVRQGNVAQMFMPDIVDPFVEAYIGYDWAGRRIFPKSYNEQDVDSQRKPRRGTFAGYGDVAKAVSRATGGNRAGSTGGGIDKSPEFYQFAVSRMLFGPGNLINRVGNQIYKGITGENESFLDISDPNDIPIFRRFIAKPNARGRNSAVFYEFFNELKQAKSDEKRYIEMAEDGAFDSIEDVYRDFGGKAAVERTRKILDLSKEKIVSQILTAQNKLKDREKAARKISDWDELREIDEERNKQHAYVRKVFDPA